jgi:copper chaperone CopZ
MKILGTIVMSLLLLAVFSPELKAQQPAGDKVVTIEANMSCDACKKTIEAGIAKEKGVKSVTADSKTKKVVVTYDGSQNTDANLVKSIEGMGYKATVSDGKKSGEASKKSGGGC